jgi:hypothetical protein
VLDPNQLIHACTSARIPDQMANVCTAVGNLGLVISRFELTAFAILDQLIHVLAAVRGPYQLIHVLTAAGSPNQLIHVWQCCEP